MILRKVRWITACFVTLAALGLSPARSSADVQILVSEVQVDSSGNVVAGSGGTPMVYTGSPLSTTHFRNITVSTTPTSSIPMPSHSLTTIVNANPNGVLNGNYGLQVIYRNNGLLNSNPNGPGNVTNNAGASAILFGTGTNTAQVTTQLFVGDIPSPDGSLANPLGAATGTATEMINQTQTKFRGPVVGLTPVDSIPGTFGMQQTIYIIVSGQNIAENSSLGGTLSSGVTTSEAVPAPGGLVLALIGLPLLGARRVLRKRAEA